MKKTVLKELRVFGQSGQLADRIERNWLIGIRETNPAILDIFHDRDLVPYRDLLPWSGEFAGKYLTSCAYTYRLTGSRELYGYVTRFIDELLRYQAPDGYLGCFSGQCHLTGAYSQNPSRTGLTWDSWAHYHMMVGLLSWYDLTGNEAYLNAVEKIAGLYMRKFYGENPPLVSIGSSEMNLAVYHSFGLLYRLTKKPAYLQFARKIEGDLSDRNAGDYINYALKGYEYYQCPKPRWESMHIVMGIAEMYRNTENPRYLEAASQIFYSILKTDVHNTGAFSTDEQAIGNPYRNSNIETCCVVAYNALGAEIYLLTGDIRAVDFLERSHYNAVLGYNNPSGRWSTYNTPMEGVKCANYHSISFQCRPGSPELNCCSVNAPRGVAGITDWMLTEDDGNLYVNFYEELHAVTEDGLCIDISGDYPAGNTVRIRIDSKGARRKIFFRIPSWSKRTEVISDGERTEPPAGKYYAVKKVWNGEITIRFDFTPYTEEGGLDTLPIGNQQDNGPGLPQLLHCNSDYRGKESVYVGPILYGFDNGDNPGVDFGAIPPLRRAALTAAKPERQEDGSIRLGIDGTVLKDFYHLGVSGSQYKTWLTVRESDES